MDQDTNLKKSAIRRIPKEDEAPKARNKVRFSSNFVKEFATNSEHETVWDATYEECIDSMHTGSQTTNSSSTQNKDTDALHADFQLNTIEKRIAADNHGIPNFLLKGRKDQDIHRPPANFLCSTKVDDSNSTMMWGSEISSPFKICSDLNFSVGHEADDILETATPTTKDVNFNSKTNLRRSSTEFINKDIRRTQLFNFTCSAAELEETEAVPIALLEIQQKQLNANKMKSPIGSCTQVFNNTIEETAEVPHAILELRRNLTTAQSTQIFNNFSSGEEMQETEAVPRAILETQLNKGPRRATQVFNFSSAEGQVEETAVVPHPLLQVQNVNKVEVADDDPDGIGIGNENIHTYESFERNNESLLNLEILDDRSALNASQNTIDVADILLSLSTSHVADTPMKRKPLKLPINLTLFEQEESASHYPRFEISNADVPRMFAADLNNMDTTPKTNRTKLFNAELNDGMEFTQPVGRLPTNFKPKPKLDQTNVLENDLELRKQTLANPANEFEQQKENNSLLANNKTRIFNNTVNLTCGSGDADVENSITSLESAMTNLLHNKPPVCETTSMSSSLLECRNILNQLNDQAMMNNEKYQQEHEEIIETSRETVQSPIYEDCQQRLPGTPERKGIPLIVIEAPTPYMCNPDPDLTKKSQTDIQDSLMDVDITEMINSRMEVEIKDASKVDSNLPSANCSSRSIQESVSNNRSTVINVLKSEKLTTNSPPIRPMTVPFAQLDFMQMEANMKNLEMNPCISMNAQNKSSNRNIRSVENAIKTSPRFEPTPKSNYQPSKEKNAVMKEVNGREKELTCFGNIAAEANVDENAQTLLDTSMPSFIMAVSSDFESICKNQRIQEELLHKNSYQSPSVKGYREIGINTTFKFVTPASTTRRAQKQAPIIRKKVTQVTSELHKSEPYIPRDYCALLYNENCPKTKEINECKAELRMAKQRIAKVREEFAHKSKLVEEYFVAHSSKLAEEVVVNPVKQINIKDDISKKCRLQSAFKLLSASDNSLEIFTVLGSIEVHINFDENSGHVEDISHSVREENLSPAQQFIYKFILRILSTPTLQSSLGKHFNVVTLLDFLVVQSDELCNIMKAIHSSRVLFNAFFDDNLCLHYKFVKGRRRVLFMLDLKGHKMSTVTLEYKSLRAPAPYAIKNKIDQLFATTTREPNFVFELLKMVHNHLNSMESNSSSN